MVVLDQDIRPFLFGDYYVNGLVAGSNFSYTAPIYPGCTVSLTAINVTVEDHDLLYTIYYTAPKDRQKSSGGGSVASGSQSKSPIQNQTKTPIQSLKILHLSLMAKEGKNPLSIRYNKGMLQKGWRQLDSATGTPGGPGVVQDVQQEHAKDENANQAAQEEAKQEQIKMNSSRKKLKILVAHGICRP